jgi:branched-chain amino acid aminotransferase
MAAFLKQRGLASAPETATDTTTSPSHPEFIIFRGELVPYDQARVHVLSTAMKFSTIVFEGLRGYWNADHGELYCFRLTDHFVRLTQTMKIARIPGPNDPEWYASRLLDLVRANHLRSDVHMRVQVFVDAEDGPLVATEPVAVCMATTPRGRFTESTGLNVGVSSWIRIADKSMPPRVKAVANYHNSRLAAMQARLDGYDDAVLLTSDGRVAEGPGYNLFMVRSGRLVTPPITEGILEGITRDSLIAIARETLNLEVVERPIDRTELYVANELFFCGSAAEVVPILSVDHHTIGTGVPGRLTLLLRDEYLATARGMVPSRSEWLTPTYGDSSIAT